MAIPISTRAAGVMITATIWNEIVTEINNIYNGVTALQHVTLDGKATASAPAVSPSGDLRFYYDTDDDEIKVSKNAGAYADFPGSVGLLQAAQDRATAEESSSSTTWTDTALSISFTPQRADSTIVLVALIAGLKQSSSSATLGLRLMRNAVVLDTFVNGGALQNTEASSGMTVFSEASPGVSAVTYKVQRQRTTGTTNALINAGGTWSSSLLVLEFAP